MQKPPSTRTEKAAHVLAVWFGCGYFPGAPGTCGTLAAVPLYLALHVLGGIGAVLAGAVVVTVVGIWAAGVVARRTGMKDPQIVVIDEVAGTLFTLAAAEYVWPQILLGVVLFRVFDSVKPWPARAIERSWPRGWGIVLDDVAAAGWSAAVLLGVRLVWSAAR